MENFFFNYCRVQKLMTEFYMTLPNFNQIPNNINELSQLRRKQIMIQQMLTQSHFNHLFPITGKFVKTKLDNEKKTISFSVLGESTHQTEGIFLVLTISVLSYFIFIVVNMGAYFSCNNLSRLIENLVKEVFVFFQIWAS